MRWACENKWNIDWWHMKEKYGWGFMATLYIFFRKILLWISEWKDRRITQLMRWFLLEIHCYIRRQLLQFIRHIWIKGSVFFTNHQKEDLSLDLSEVFKPVIVFKTIFDLVNNRRLQVEKHFDKQVNYCVLNEEGRKIFIESFEERLESVFMHPKLKRKVSYRTALKLDCYKLIKNILEEKEFVPFSLKEGM